MESLILINLLHSARRVLDLVEMEQFAFICRMLITPSSSKPACSSVSLDIQMKYWNSWRVIICVLIWPFTISKRFMLKLQTSIGAVVQWYKWVEILGGVGAVVRYTNEKFILFYQLSTQLRDFLLLRISLLCAWIRFFWYCQAPQLTEAALGSFVIEWKTGLNNAFHLRYKILLFLIRNKKYNSLLFTKPHIHLFLSKQLVTSATIICNLDKRQMNKLNKANLKEYLQHKYGESMENTQSTSNAVSF